MAVEEPSKMSWSQWFAWLLGLLVSVTTIAGYFGFKFGQDKQAHSLNVYIEDVADTLSPKERQSAQPVLNVLKAAVNNAIAGNTAPADVSRTAQQLTQAVTTLPTELYSSRGQRIVSVGKGHTAIMCGDQHHVAYNGPATTNVSYVIVDGQNWTILPGEQRKFSGGVVTLQEASADHAVFDVQCGP